MEEEWIDIAVKPKNAIRRECFPYQVSNFGRVKRTPTGKTLKPFLRGKRKADNSKTGKFLYTIKGVK